MTERERTPDSAATPPNASTATPGQATSTGIYDAPDKAPAQNQRLVGMYDRPERAGPSPTVLIAAAIVIILLIIALVYFVF